MKRPETIYRLCSRAEVDALQASDFLPANADDQRDGFLHFSTRDQIPGTAAKHYAHVKDLMLIGVDAASLGADLRWEISRGGDEFPHVHGQVPRAAMVLIRPVPCINDQFQFPEQLFS